MDTVNAAWRAGAPGGVQDCGGVGSGVLQGDPSVIFLLAPLIPLRFIQAIGVESIKEGMLRRRKRRRRKRRRRRGSP